LLIILNALSPQSMIRFDTLKTCTFKSVKQNC